MCVCVCVYIHKEQFFLEYEASKYNRYGEAYPVYCYIHWLYIK